MGRFRQGSIAKRVAISVIALYALMLQAFVAAAAPASGFDFLDGSNCVQDASGTPTPGGAQHRHHGLCCILACAAACAYVAMASGIAIFPIRAASPFVWAQTPSLPNRPPQKFYFAARGPPQSL
ncbi:hypothetical protein [Methylocapsa aurea]|uniref:hypothetical protein n=1 Tax=Methylocapsa aurea TaxID=663610 RepID=UPI00055EAF34|nr:hypothetical protein [Methylocapsa aurea]